MLGLRKMIVRRGCSSRASIDRFIRICMDHLLRFSLLRSRWRPFSPLEDDLESDEEEELELREEEEELEEE